MLKKDLRPLLTAEGEENVEAISIYITLGKIIILYTSAYDPQPNGRAINKIGFWEYLDIIAVQGGKERVSTCRGILIHCLEVILLQKTPIYKMRTENCFPTFSWLW